MDRRAFLFSAAAGPALSQDRLDRDNLLLYRDSNGRARQVRTTREWLRRRDEILRGMQSVMGPLPGNQKRCPLEPRVEEEIDAGTHIRRLISYAAEPGARVPAYLLIPKGLQGSGKQAPAALALHPTDHKIGHKVVVGLGGRPNRQYAVELAERGYVTLAPSYPLLADYRPDWKALGYQSGTMKAIWDNIRGLDYLETLPFVRKGAFGAIGHSLGGHNSVYTAVFEDRIKAVVSSCGLDSYMDYKDGDIRGWTSDRYMPKLLAYRERLQDLPFDFHEMIGALAPRACFISAPLRDDNFKAASVDRIVAAARPVYQLYGKPENLSVEHPDAAHDFPDEMRQRGYALFDRHLRSN
ncbi:MAG: prolyl oligopeptidase family serine peptidase [Acidobacteria bacterium]|nr:prolyl oligopeptidase family serine peptidase [Acidobacteriota bacterium]